MRHLLELGDRGLVSVNAIGHPRTVQVRIVGTTDAARAALQTARPGRTAVAPVLTTDERRDIDVFVGLLRAALGEVEKHRPGPLDGTAAGAVEELRADLETLSAQLKSPRPKRLVVVAVLVGVGSVTPSVIGSAAGQLATQLRA